MQSRFLIILTSIIAIASLFVLPYGLVRYGAVVRQNDQAHQLFVDGFQSGVQMAYSSVVIAYELAGQGKVEAAATYLNQAFFGIDRLWSGAAGITIRAGGTPWSPAVKEAYQDQIQEAQMLLGEGGFTTEAKQVLADLAEDLAVLGAMVGEPGQSEHLTGPRVREFPSYYTTWRQKARIRAQGE